MITVDVIIATYNRAESLRRLLASLKAAEVPAGMRIRLTAVDNRSTDHTKSVIEEAGVPYLYEPQQGQSAARNAGLARASADWVAFFDDDESVSPSWFAIAERAIHEHPSAQFFGGPYRAVWPTKLPSWVTPELRFLLGDYDFGPEQMRYDGSFPGVLPGGNCLVRRDLFKVTGPYDTRIGHVAGRPIGNDDTEMYHRLLASGAEGWYIPDLSVKHFIPDTRLRKSYARRLKLCGGIAMGMIDRWQEPPVARVAGIPRYILGDLVRGLRRRSLFESELLLWYAAGFARGRRIEGDNA